LSFFKFKFTHLPETDIMMKHHEERFYNVKIISEQAKNSVFFFYLQNIKLLIRPTVLHLRYAAQAYTCVQVS